MIPVPTVRPWHATLEVELLYDVGVRVHASTTENFTPTDATFRGVLYAPGFFRILGLTPGVDYYVKLTDFGGEDVSDPSVAVRVAVS